MGIFLAQNQLHYLGVNVRVFKTDNNWNFGPIQNLTIGKADFNLFMRLRNQLVLARQNVVRGKFVLNANTSDVQRQEWTTQTGSKVERRRRPRKWKKMCDSAAVQREKARVFIWSSPNICKEEEGREISTNCLYELETWRKYLSAWFNEFCIWWSYWW